MSPSGSPPWVRVKVMLCVISGDSTCAARVVERREERGRRERKRIVDVVCGGGGGEGEVEEGRERGKKKKKEKWGGREGEWEVCTL